MRVGYAVAHVCILQTEWIRFRPSKQK